MNNYHMYRDGAWKNSASEAQDFMMKGAGSPVPYTPPTPATKASWAVPNLYDHTSLLDCTRCTQGNHASYGVQGVSSGQGSILNAMEGEVMQELQYGMDYMEEEEEMGMEQTMRMLKKRKLTEEQARQLEASFEADKKLEAEKKQRLAAQLGLQPRQVAVWFQNRRARSKTKQLEIDFIALKADYDRVVAQRRALQDEVARLATLLQAKNSEAKIDPCNQDSTSSTNSNNGELVSESTTRDIKIESLIARDGLAPNTSTSPSEMGKPKEIIPIRSQDLDKYSSINSYSYEWEPYDNGLWVFD